MGIYGDVSGGQSPANERVELDVERLDDVIEAVDDVIDVVHLKLRPLQLPPVTIS